MLLRVDSVGCWVSIRLDDSMLKTRKFYQGNCEPGTVNAEQHVDVSDFEWWILYPKDHAAEFVDHEPL